MDGSSALARNNARRREYLEDWVILGAPTLDLNAIRNIGDVIGNTPDLGGS